MNPLHQSLSDIAVNQHAMPPDHRRDRRTLADTDATGRIPRDLSAQLTEAFNQAEASHGLDHASLTTMKNLLDDGHDHTMSTAAREIGHWTGTRNPQTMLNSLELALARAGTRTLLRCARHWPPQPPCNVHPDRADSAAEAARLLLNPVMALREQTAWSQQIRALDLVTTELEHYGATGEPPPWFVPEEMTPTAADRERGHSAIHPRPFDPTSRAAVAVYVRRRMQLFLAPLQITDGRNASLHHQLPPQLLLDLLLSAHVNWDLAGHAGPGNRALPTHHRIPPSLRLTGGHSPMDHASLSYKIALQPRVSPLDLKLQTRARDADAVARRMTDTALTMPRLERAFTDLAHRMPAESDHARATIPNYEPQLRWDQSPEKNAQALNALSNGMTDPHQLVTHIGETHGALVDLHLSAHIGERASRTAQHNHMDQDETADELKHQIQTARQSSFGHQLLAECPPAGRPLNSPETVLLIEGMEALHQCRETALRLHQTRLQNGPIAWTDEELAHFAADAKEQLLNQMAHADWCVVAAHLLLNRTPSHQPELLPSAD